MSSPVKRSSGGDPLEHSKVSNFRPSLREQGLNTLGEQLGTTCSASKSRRQRMSEFWFLHCVFKCEESLIKSLTITVKLAHRVVPIYLCRTQFVF